LLLKVLTILVEIHRSMSDDQRDYAAELQCLQHLDDAASAADALKALLKGVVASFSHTQFTCSLHLPAFLFSWEIVLYFFLPLHVVSPGSSTHALLAYQLGFDIAESEHQPFILALLENLSPQQSPAGASSDAAEPVGEAGAASAAVAAAAAPAPSEPVDPVFEERVGRLTRVLSASGFMVDLQLNFVHGQSKADALLLLAVKDSLEPRNTQTYMTLHQATVAAHGFMFAGTANTGFVREQMEWVHRPPPTYSSLLVLFIFVHLTFFFWYCPLSWHVFLLFS
jgi:hypothetical protein